ncbi:hypothetical protein [Hyphomicrobium sp.]|uniref:hypothetical protein n=1 Tax=Hyphomicrobium sp. TaxID=82 RepID=UPI002FDDE929
MDVDLALIAGWEPMPPFNFIGPSGELEVPRYTASLDAALALVKQMLPGLAWSRDGLGRFYLTHAGVPAELGPPIAYTFPVLANDALTCVAFLLRAIIAKQEVADAEC